jgi:hypothetical protein
MLIATDSKSIFGMFGGVLVALAAASPSWGNMANLTDYRDDAVQWAMRVGFTSDCAGPVGAAAVEAEAEAGSALLAPGFWNWLNGKASEEKRKLFDDMWAAYTVGAAEAKATEGPETCGLRQAELDLMSALLSQKRARYAAD